ncbi:hypothetical protein [Rhodohalobacter mucosus]|uniref:hypothetical protein n=1 Tax=Rhodohalobacter mucosus TaxID=2079485 RepID=UPI0013047F2A|nr:hypothetical protein [Rhodohalobacter mucosus]
MASEIWKEIHKSSKLDQRDDAFLYYSIQNLKYRLNYLSNTFNGFESLHSVAIKTNPHPYILKKISDWGYGLEAASLQEVLLAAKTGIEPQKIIYNSPVKTRNEIEYASKKFSGLILNANCLEELQRIPKKNNFNLGLRINPLVSGETFNLYDVSGKYSKFGVPINKTDLIFKAVKEHSISQLHMHVGSKETDLSRPLNAIKRVVDLAGLINQSLGQKIDTINIGGGLSAGDSNSESMGFIKKYVKSIEEDVPELSSKFKIITEFGQWVHEHQGVTFSRVEYIRNFEEKAICYIHIGADMFVRNTYAPDKELKLICLDSSGNLKEGKEKIYDIAGPLCFNGDYLSRNYKLPLLEEGDFIVIKSTGANTYGLWSRHCSRNIPALFVDQIHDSKIKKVSKSWNPFLKAD